MFATINFSLIYSNNGPHRNVPKQSLAQQINLISQHYSSEITTFGYFGMAKPRHTNV